jgi:fructoselysine-6-P-deglycase FrlB-like protein
MNGLSLIRYEMARQYGDALVSFEASHAMAKQIAESVLRTGRLCLLGMGGSHWVNRAAMFAYREIGIEVQAEVLSEVLFRRLPDQLRTVVLVSQSGNSGEIAHYLKTPSLNEERFGMTLNGDSSLAQTIPCLIAAGGAEKAFAATRSIFLSHVLHLAVMQAMGVEVGAALAAILRPADFSIVQVLDELQDCETIILSGRSELQGVAESGALCLMELARMPTYALEGGQLRHGPFEFLNSSTGIILLRAAGAAEDLTAALAADCVKTGARVVVFDCSGQPPVPGLTTVPFERHAGMAAVFAVLPALQNLLVEIANGKVENVGVPLRSSKVTTAL